MRMWMVNPAIMCRQHLLGEHVECHMFVGTLNKGRRVTGYLDTGLLEIHNLRKRHDELVYEMARRGMEHKSPLPKFKKERLGHIDKSRSLADLLTRCAACRELRSMQPFKHTHHPELLTCPQCNRELVFDWGPKLLTCHNFWCGYCRARLRAVVDKRFCDQCKRRIECIILPTIISKIYFLEDKDFE